MRVTMYGILQLAGKMVLYEVIVVSDSWNTSIRSPFIVDHINRKILVVNSHPPFTDLERSVGFAIISNIEFEGTFFEARFQGPLTATSDFVSRNVVFNIMASSCFLHDSGWLS